MTHVGREIKRHREKQELNQTRLAALVGTGPAAISRIENGRQNPNSVTLVKLADALGVEVADFFPKVQLALPTPAEIEGVPFEELLDLKESLLRLIRSLDTGMGAMRDTDHRTKVLDLMDAANLVIGRLERITERQHV
jgi:transcriptional regulator with XRE-family HTH domain